MRLSTPSIRLPAPGRPLPAGRLAARLLVLGVAFLLLAAPAGLRRPAPDASPSSFPCAEPQLPLRLSWEQAELQGLPGEVSLSLVLESRADLAAVRLEILLPRDVGLLAGECSFQGALARGESRRIPLRLRTAGGNEGRLEARAAAVTREGITFRRGASFDLGRPARAAGPPGLVHQDPSGRRVREFPAAAGLAPGGAGEAGAAGGPG